MQPIRWGILGLGRIAHKFAADLQTLPNATLHAVAATDTERARAFAAQYAVPHAFGCYEDLITCPDLDVVYIATRHVRHHENTLLCLRAGLPVLCEKPFAMNARQVQEMVETARQQRVFLMEALWSRFMPTTVKALEIIASGAIGKVLSLQADFGFKAPYDPEKRLFNKNWGGGALLDIGIYPLFLSYLVLGRPATLKASALIGPTGVDESCGIVLTYSGGQMATLQCTLLAKTPCEAFIFGEKGSIRILGRWHESQALELELYDSPHPQMFAFPRQTWGYDYEAAAVMASLQAGQTENPHWTLTDSLHLMHLLDAVRHEAGIVYEAFDTETPPDRPRSFG